MAKPPLPAGIMHVNSQSLSVGLDTAKHIADALNLQYGRSVYVTITYDADTKTIELHRPQLGAVVTNFYRHSELHNTHKTNTSTQRVLAALKIPRGAYQLEAGDALRFKFHHSHGYESVHNLPDRPMLLKQPQKGDTVAWYSKRYDKVLVGTVQALWEHDSLIKPLQPADWLKGRGHHVKPKMLIVISKPVPTEEDFV